MNALVGLGFAFEKTNLVRVEAKFCREVVEANLTDKRPFLVRSWFGRLMHRC